MSNEDVREIVTQLEDLHLRQAALISRLARLSESDDDTTNLTSPDTTRKFVVGDRVRIRNLRLLQVNKGKIVRIGEKNRITILTSRGAKLIRAPKNLILEQDE